ncbi:hypothetical protein APHAL10511_002933 [Amanita phalloides]|nr:hypothetical protein APHAL10511_002933 [Amanita phalloides]
MAGHFGLLHYGRQIHGDIDLGNVWYLPSPVTSPHPSKAKHFFRSSFSSDWFLELTDVTLSPDFGWDEILDRLDGDKNVMGVIADSRHARGLPLTGPGPDLGIGQFEEQLGSTADAVYTYLGDLEGCWRRWKGILSVWLRAIIKDDFYPK